MAHGVVLSFAAMDVTDARDEIDWAHPHDVDGAVVIDGDALCSDGDVSHSTELLAWLLDRVIGHATVLLHRTDDERDAASLRRVIHGVRAARGRLRELAP